MLPPMPLTSTEGRVVAWAIVALATAAVIVRPFRWPEAIWAVGGALLLVLLGLLPVASAVAAVGAGTDVYLFLVGMMVLSEVARREGLFDSAAAMAVNHARGSPRRLFLLIYAIGIVVTTFLSNDATAVVLTPAVLAATRKARVDPLPYLFVCAFVANAASFVLPISNPANIVLYGDRTPPLGNWLSSFALPSLVSIVATCVALRLTEGVKLPPTCETRVDASPLSRGAVIALVGIAATAVVLLVVSAIDRPLGLPTSACGLATMALVAVATRTSPSPVARGVAWSVLPLVAGLFVLVEALKATGVVARLAGLLTAAVDASPAAAAWGAGLVIAFGSNATNNLPAGLVASSTVALARPPQAVVDALLIGVDLGPNLSVTGSLATILWLLVLRREGLDVGFWRFLRLGVVVMLPALLLALAARWLIH